VLTCLENGASLIFLDAILQPEATAARHKPKATPDWPSHTVGILAGGTVNDACESEVNPVNSENDNITNRNRLNLESFILFFTNPNECPGLFSKGFENSHSLTSFTGNFKRKQ